MSERSASPHSDRHRTWPAEHGSEGRWLEYLTGVHSQKPRYFGRWRRTSADLARTLQSLQDVASALSATAAGPEVVARSIAAVASSHFGDAYCVLSIDGMPVATVGRQSRQASIPREGSTGVPSAFMHSGATKRGSDGGSSLEAVAAHLGAAVVRSAGPLAVLSGDDDATEVVDPNAACTPEGLLESVLALAAPLVIERNVVGTLVVALTTSSILDQSDLSILAILANQGAVAIDAARRFEEQIALHQRAVEGWNEAARVAAALDVHQRELERAHIALDVATRQRLIDQERYRIAGELHDNVVQNLVRIGMSLEWSRRATSEAVIAEHLASTQELARLTLARLRQTIFEFACVTEIDVLPALEDLAKELHGRAEVLCSVRGTASALDVPLAHAVFHIAQEATYNAIHHGRAGRVWIALNVGRAGITLNVSDNGTGDPAVVAGLLEHCLDTRRSSPYHTGLRGIRRRATELGAAVTVTRRRGGGIRLQFRAPLRQDLRAQ